MFQMLVAIALLFISKVLLLASSQDCAQQNVCLLPLIVGRKGDNLRISSACSFSTRGMRSTCTSVLSDFWSWCNEGVELSTVDGIINTRYLQQLCFIFCWVRFREACCCLCQGSDCSHDCSHVSYACRNQWRPTGHQVQRVSTGSRCMSAARWGPRSRLTYPA
jgi:hypothetical protein